MAMTKHERRLQREQQRARLRSTLTEIAEGGAVGKADCVVVVAAAVAAAHGKVGGNGGDDIANKQEESAGRGNNHERTVDCATRDEAELPKPTEYEGNPVEANHRGEVVTKETYEPHTNEGNGNNASLPRSTDEGDGNDDGNAVRNEATRVPTVRSDLENGATGPCAALDVMQVDSHEERVDQDDAGHELGSNPDAPLAPSIMKPTASDASTASVEESQLVLEPSTASLGNETIPKKLSRGVKKASPVDPDESMHRDAVQPTIVQLEDDIQRLVCKRQKKRNSCPDPEGNSASTTALSPTPSEAATDATELGGADERNGRGDAEKLVNIDSKTARIHQLESELALAQRKVDALETEISAWVEAADKQQDYRSHLLAAQVKQRTFAERLHRTVDMLDINAGGLNAGASRSVIELFELADELGRPHTRLLDQQDAIDLAESLVFPAQQAVTGCAGKLSSATSWLWENQRTLFAEDYSVRVMRLSEEPLKRRRSDNASGLAIATPLVTPEENPPALPTFKTVQLHSPPQVKRQRLIEDDDDSASSDEEEFVCDVDSSGKVTARTTTYEPAAREDPGADDIFLAISM